jgi:hypothetical protein
VAVVKSVVKSSVNRLAGALVDLCWRASALDHAEEVAAFLECRKRVRGREHEPMLPMLNQGLPRSAVIDPRASAGHHPR